MDRLRLRELTSLFNGNQVCVTRYIYIGSMGEEQKIYAKDKQIGDRSCIEVDENKGGVHIEVWRMEMYIESCCKLVNSLIRQFFGGQYNTQGLENSYIELQEQIRHTRLL